ncbi:MAG: DUF1611 domain-containing protein [Candidatus Krumholzibacteria bacterium]
MPLNEAPFTLGGRKALLLADGEFSVFGSKTATCYVRYRGDDVVAVVDRSQAGRSAQDVLGFGGAIPVVSDVVEALVHDPDVAVVGVAPSGGQLTAALHEQILQCVQAGLDVVSGLHSFLSDDAVLAQAARQSGSRFWDVRSVPGTTRIGSGAGCTTGAMSVLAVGSDCNVGKMTATVELYREAKRRKIATAWAATGQTGMMLRGRGIAIDRVVADFIGGAVEELVEYEAADKQIVFVEGQGSIIHPGFAGVALGLMYGVMPDCMVLVHAASRRTIGDTEVAMPPLAELVRLHEALMQPFKASPVVAIAVNTFGLGDAEARESVARIERQTGLPARDPLRHGAEDLVDAILGRQARGGRQDGDSV